MSRRKLVLIFRLLIVACVLAVAGGILVIGFDQYWAFAMVVAANVLAIVGTAVLVVGIRKNRRKT